MKPYLFIAVVLLLWGCKERKSVHQSNILIAGHDTISNFDDTIFIHPITIHDTIYIHDTVYKVKNTKMKETQIYDGELEMDTSGFTYFTLDSSGKIIDSTHLPAFRQLKSSNQ